jgi:polysaccharide chain length determinant protein (PEP-CTERM system associated)
MRDLLLEVLGHIWGMWRYRWPALLVAWLVSLAGWVFVSTLPPIYQSSAVVQVDTESALAPLLHGLAVQADPMAEVDMLSRTLLSRPNLEELAGKADLGLAVETPADMDRAVRVLEAGLRLGKDHGNNGYWIKYIGRDPEMAHRAVKALLDMFIEKGLGSDRTKSYDAQRFLERQVKAYEQRLNEAESRLAEFKKSHVGMMPNQGQDYFGRLQAAMVDLARMRAELRVTQSRRRELRRQLAGEEPVFGLMGAQGSGDSPLDAQIQEFQGKISELSLRYTEKHPDIIALKEIISELEQKKAQQREATAGLGAMPSQALEMNPVYQSMKIALGEAEVDVAALQAQVADQQRQVKELKNKVDSIPQVEADLKRLNRDYAITKQQHDALVSRLETARLSGQAEQSGEGIDFRVLQPPSLPTHPVGPNRMLFNGVALVGGLAAGIAMAFFLNQISAVFSDARTLQKALGLPVLGAVSLKRGSRERFRLAMGLASFVLGLTLLGALYGGTVMFEDKARQVIATVVAMGRHVL